MTSELASRKSKPNVAHMDRNDLDIISRLASEKNSRLNVGSEKVVMKTKVKRQIIFSLAIISFVLLMTFCTYLLFFSSLTELSSDANHKVENGATIPKSPETIDDGSLIQTTFSKVSLEVSGYVVARNKSSVSSDITGRIKEIYVDIGQQVKKGELIAILDDREAQFLLVEKKLNVKKIELDIEKAEHEKEFLDKSFKRQRNLVPTGNISEEAFDKAEQNKDKARIHLESLMLNLESADNILKSTEIFVERHMIKAPFDGIIVEVSARPGETVSPSSSGNSFIRTGIAQIVDPSDLYVEASVPEKYLNQIKVEQSAKVLMSGDEVMPISASVLWIAPVSNRQRGVVDVGVKLPSDIEGLLDGMEVKVKFLQEH